MEPIPVPSHIHYELLLRLLERQTLPVAERNSPLLREQTQQLIITLRKALAQQKQIEANCQQRGAELDYRWSLNGAPALGDPLEGVRGSSLFEPLSVPELPGQV